MRTYKNEEITTVGFCALVYGPPDYGKTYSASTLPEPIAFINNESKDPRLVLGATGKKIDYYEPDDFYDEMELIQGWIEQAKEGKFPYKSVFKDGLTFTQSQYKLKLEDDRYEARVLKKEARPGLIDRFRMDQADWGTANSMMIRNTSLLNKLSKFGIIVVCTAISQENPKWDMELACAPALQGREYASVIQGYFDLIGLIVEPWRVLEDGAVRPPIVSFASEDGRFLARVTGERLAKRSRGVLDWSKIAKILTQKD